MAFVACLLTLQIINDIAFHQNGLQSAGIYAAIALTAIELAIFAIAHWHRALECKANSGKSHRTGSR